ncbi:MAG: hypothetical protein HYT93_00395 [Parcubacteria group bacterium]|nr:hypothetical protein [Parcubacteria group bacterium]
MGLSAILFGRRPVSVPPASFFQKVAQKINQEKPTLKEEAQKRYESHLLKDFETQCKSALKETLRWIQDGALEGQYSCEGTDLALHDINYKNVKLRERLAQMVNELIAQPLVAKGYTVEWAWQDSVHDGCEFFPAHPLCSHNRTEHRHMRMNISWKD